MTVYASYLYAQQRMPPTKVIFDGEPPSRFYAFHMS
jgi:hypothetical protein